MEAYILEFWDQDITEEITYLMMTFKVSEEEEEEEKKSPNPQNNKMKFKKVIANYKNFK